METKTKIGLLLLAGLFVASLLSGTLMKGSPVALPAQKVAVITLHGTIGDVSSFLGSNSIDVDQTIELIRSAADSPVVGAIVLDINSEGGGASATQTIVDAVKYARGKKPVVSYVSDVGASGGYWIAASANKLVVSPLSLTGSIGVISDFVDASGFLAKYGFNFQTIKTGKYKDMGSPSRPLTDEEIKIVQEISNQVYDEFVNGIAETRSMDVTYLKTLAQGQVFLGKQAVKLGLADSTGTKEDAVNLAAGIAGIKGTPETVQFATKMSWQEILNELAGTFGYGLGQGVARVSSGGISIST